MFILETYALLVTFNGFPVFEIRKNLDLRKILGVTNIFLKSRFFCLVFTLTISRKVWKKDTSKIKIQVIHENLELMTPSKTKLFLDPVRYISTCWTSQRSRSRLCSLYPTILCMLYIHIVGGQIVIRPRAKGVWKTTQY